MRNLLASPLRRVVTPLALAAPLAACASSPRVAAVATPAPSAASPCPCGGATAERPSAPRDETAANATSPHVDVLLRPVFDGGPRVEVEIAALGEKPLRTFRMAIGAPDAITHVSASDDRGLVAVSVAAAPPGVVATLARDPVGVVRLRYAVRANLDPASQPIGELVLEDRFRGSGEALLLLPEALDDVAVPIELRIDGGPLRAPNAASSLGVGTPRRTRARVRTLRRASFLAGSMGAARFDAIEGHDEAAWLGYTAFDPRPASAEIAQIRTGISELFKAHDEPPQTALFFAQTRPLGSFTTTARAGSLLVQVGPSEPWSAALRLSLAQQMMHRWIGGEIWVGPTDAEHEPESWWFTEGVARFEATRLLVRLGLLAPNDARDAIAGEMSVVTTSPHRGKPNAALAAIARSDGTARAHLAARGALFAAAENARIEARSKGAESLDAVISALLERARATRGPLPNAAWDEEAGKRDPAAAAERERVIVQGNEPLLPAGALGPCFRAGTGEYAAFDLGFDADATAASRARVVVGVREGGPAAKAGLRDGDVLEAGEWRDGRSDLPVKLTVTRGAAKLELKYLPRGERRRGQTWTRVPGVADDRCGDVL